MEFLFNITNLSFLCPQDNFSYKLLYGSLGEFFSRPAHLAEFLPTHAYSVLVPLSTVSATPNYAQTLSLFNSKGGFKPQGLTLNFVSTIIIGNVF